MAKKAFEIQGSDLNLGGVSLQAGTTGVVIPGVSQAVDYFVEEVEEQDGSNPDAFGSNVNAITIIDNSRYLVLTGTTPSGSYVAATYSVDELDDGQIEEINVDTEGVFLSADKTLAEASNMWATTTPTPFVSFNPANWTQIPFRPKIRAGEVENVGGGGSSNQLVETEDNNTFTITEDGDVVFSGETGGVNRGLVWDYGVEAGGVDSMVRQDQNGLTVRAYTEVGEGVYSAPVNIVTNQELNQKTWTFDGDGALTFPDGSVQTTAYTATTTDVSKFVLVNQDGGVYGSNDGETWAGPFDTGLAGIRRVAVGPSRVVYIGSTEPDPEYNNLYQTTAWNVTPTLVTDEGPAEWEQVRYFSSIEQFVAVGSIDGVAAYKHSSDGITWVTVYIDTEWAATLNEGGGPGTSGFTDVATNGTGFLLTTDNIILGSFYTTTLTSNSSIGESAWLNDGMDFQEVVYAAQGAFTGWFAFGDGNTDANDGWWYNSEFNPSNDSFVTSWGISDISEAFANNVGYEPNWSELVIGRYNGIDTIVIATGNGQVLYWPAVPEGPFVSIPKPYTSTITNISSNTVASISFTGASEASPVEKIVITGVTPSDFNGTYYYNISDTGLYTDSALSSPFDTTGLTYVSGGTITWSHGMYIDALNYANGKFYVANDSEEVFVSANGGATWTEVASLNPEGPPGDDGNGPGTGTNYMNDIDGYVGTGVIDTGNFTFSADTITNENGMLVATDRGTLAIGTDMEVPGQPTHFHIAFDGSNSEISSNDLFLGDDFNYVLVSAYANGIEIGTNDRDGGSQHTWNFKNDGGITFPTLTVPISDNATPSGTGQTIKFSNPSQQAIIYGPASTTDYINAERVIIQGAPGYIDTTGEGGDVYLWAGPGGSAGGDGGDIKIRAGRGIAAGNGGYLNFQAGNSTDGIGGYINIESGSSANGTGGNITIDANSGGQLALYTAAGGNITLNTAGGNNVWTFDSTGKTTLPGAVVKSTTAITGVDLTSNNVKFEVTQVDGLGAVTEIIVTNSPNPVWVTNTNGLALGDVNFSVTFDGSGNASVVVNSGGTGHTVGQTFELNPDAVGATPPTPTAIDLTKSINSIGDGTYTLADGVEGQIMYLVPNISTINSESNVFVSVAHARAGALQYSDITLYPFYYYVGAEQVFTSICTLIFTQGHWQQIGGSWD